MIIHPAFGVEAGPPNDYGKIFNGNSGGFRCVPKSGALLFVQRDMQRENFGHVRRRFQSGLDQRQGRESGCRLSNLRQRKNLAAFDRHQVAR